MSFQKKPVSKKSMPRRASKPAGSRLSSLSSKETHVSSNGKHHERPHHKKLETDEEREKRLAKREALTLRAFQIAYDNHHPRKSS
jgi:hypothetical protein